jgi:hypothetical protein
MRSYLDLHFGTYLEPILSQGTFILWCLRLPTTEK